MDKQVELFIGGRTYKMTVEQNQEARLQEVATYLDQQIDKMRKATGNSVDRDNLLILTAMMVTDELFNKKDTEEKAESMLSALHNNIAERLETMTSNLES